MEKAASCASVNDAICVFKEAKLLESEMDYDRAMLKYQLAAKILVEIVNNTEKSDEKYKEYKSLANEILTKAEKLKNKKGTEEVKRGVASYLFGKHLKKPEGDLKLSKSTTNRKPATTYISSSKIDSKYHSGGGMRKPSPTFSRGGTLAKPSGFENSKISGLSKIEKPAMK